jgi:hypothetical protein
MRALGLVALLFAGVASAQPMMMDPMKVSGIPRPDPQVPAGTITVRLVRGKMDNRMVGVAVTLSGGDKPVVQKTDPEGRATFGGLGGSGPFVASAKDGEVEQKSQPMTLEAGMGTRVLLAFPMGSALGAPDGMGHLDKTLPAGTVVVRAEDASGNAVEGLDVTLAHARQGDKKVEQLQAKTDTAGEARFDKLDRSPTSGYVARVVAHGAPFDGKPFKLEETAGMRVVVQVRPVSADTSKLVFGEGSHLLVEISDDGLQVIEVLRLRNASGAAVDPGADGLHIPLPDDAVQAQAADSPNLSVVGHEAIWKGPIPAGDTQVRIGFVIAHKGGHGEIVQKTPVPFAKVALVTQDLEGVQVSGNGVVGEPTDMQGKKLVVYRGEATQRGGELSLSFTGLPEANATPRYLAAGIVIFIVLVFGAYAVGGHGAERAQLESERAKLFDELASIDAAIARGDKKPEDREKHVARLAEIYRGLDELGGG